MENEVVDTPTFTGTLQNGAEAVEAPVEIVEELLVEEISIDGMCGVY